MKSWFFQNWNSLLTNFIVGLLFLVIGLVIPKIIKFRGKYNPLFDKIDEELFSIKKKKYSEYIKMLKSNDKCIIDLRTELIYKGITVIIGMCFICFILLLILINYFMKITDAKFIKISVIIIVALITLFEVYRIFLYLQLRDIIKHLIDKPHSITEFYSQQNQVCTEAEKNNIL